MFLRAVLLSIMLPIGLALIACGDQSVDVIPPCTPIEEASVDPCEPGATGVSRGSEQTSRSILFDSEPRSIEWYLDPEGDVWDSHIVLRGTYIPGTVRCAQTGKPYRLPSHASGNVDEWFGLRSILCYSDVRVNDYIVGSGPSVLTLIVGKDSYWHEDSGATPEYLRQYVGLMEKELVTGENTVPRFAIRRGGIGGREEIMFIAPTTDTSVAAWRVVATWGVERQEDDTVVAVHPYRQAWKSSGLEDISKVEVPLPTFETASATAARERSTRYSGRTNSGPDYPMIVTNAGQLGSYLSEVGAIGHKDGEPVLPPEPCGLVVANQADNPDLMRDCIALLGSKDDLRGTASLNWSTATLIASWDGVTVAGTPKRITRLKLANEGLTGIIPHDLATLTGLTELKLAGNTLTGCIPVGLEGVADNDLASLNLLYCQPPTPRNLRAGAPGEFSTPLSWNAVANTDKYRIEYRLHNPLFWTLGDDAIVSTSHTSGGLECEQAYEFRVSAHGSGTTYAAAWSEPSALVSATTTTCVSPVFDQESYTFVVSEDAAMGAAVGTVSATDPQGDALVYVIAEGNAGGKFTIGTDGALKVAATLDYETTPSYVLTIQASDGTNVSTVQVTITVTDENDAPVFEEAHYTFLAAEDAAVGDTVGTVSATDADEGDTLTYSITGGNEDGNFAIDASTGTITVAVALDFETTPSYELTVEATDGTNAASATVVVSVTDVNESPAFEQDSYSFSPAEDASVGAAVGTVTATDPDEGDTVTYSITAGNSGSVFAIGDETGEITVAGDLSGQAGTTVTLTVEATDGTTTTTVAVEITIAG